MQHYGQFIADGAAAAYMKVFAFDLEFAFKYVATLFFFGCEREHVICRVTSFQGEFAGYIVLPLFPVIFSDTNRIWGYFSTLK